MNNAVTVRSPARLDPATHSDCLQYLRSAIATNDRQTARDIKNVLAEVCASGYADRDNLWRDLSQAEQNQFKELLAPPPMLWQLSARQSLGSSIGCWVLVFAHKK